MVFFYFNDGCVKSIFYFVLVIFYFFVHGFYFCLMS